MRETKKLTDHVNLILIVYDNLLSHFMPLELVEK